jgi:DNA-binding Xre family transcriptional regulator
MSGQFPIAIANRIIAEKKMQLHQQMREIEATEQNLMALRKELNQIYSEGGLSEDTA